VGSTDAAPPADPGTAPEGAQSQDETASPGAESGWMDPAELEAEGSTTGAEAEWGGAATPGSTTGEDAPANTQAVPPPTVDAAGGLSPTPTPAPRNTLGCRGNAGCVKLTAGGIVVSALAAGSVAGGVVLTLKDDQVLAEDPTRMRTYRPAGEMMLTLGAGFLATGVLMLVASRYGDGVRDESAKRRRARRGGRK
jgi:hypothetical protein